MDKLNSVFKLREMLFQMERDVGLENLSRVERDVFLAAHSVSQEHGPIIRSECIRQHKLVKPVAQATFHRALRSLLDEGLLERAGNSKAKRYVVRGDLVDL